MGKAIFVDLTRCTGCRGCQVACKQWKNLPGEETRNTGSHQNPPDLSFTTIRLVRFQEVREKNKLEWLFFPEQCRHCYGAPCKGQADATLEGAMMQDDATGAVYTTDKITQVPGDEVRSACPYNIPRAPKDNKGVSKCDFCFDRISNGMKPSCVLACPTGTMNYGDEDDMLKLANERLEIVKKQYPDAVLGDPDSVRVIYLFQSDPKKYYENAVAEAVSPVTRKELFAGIFGGKKKA